MLIVALFALGCGISFLRLLTINKKSLCFCESGVKELSSLSVDPLPLPGSVPECEMVIGCFPGADFVPTTSFCSVTGVGWGTANRKAAGRARVFLYYFPVVVRSSPPASLVGADPQKPPRTSPLPALHVEAQGLPLGHFLFASLSHSLVVS